MPPRRKSLTACIAAALLAACSTPYQPPITVHDSAPFPGVATVVAAAGTQPVDVLLVHGMCTHDQAWARSQIDGLAGTVAGHAPAAAALTTAGPVHVVEDTRKLAGGVVRFHALVWSPLTTGLKHQLDYDHTATPTDCAATGECKPKRASFNGYVKDKLLDDCLSDPMIYEGQNHAAMRDAMVDALARILQDNPNGAGTLIVVAESLGSKILFDVLASMLESQRPEVRNLGQDATRRLGLLFMAGNQLPMLGLAEQSAVPALAMPQDALQRFLALRRTQAAPRVDELGRLAIVAFTDPNDLLSYRLLPARYAAPDVAVADVLVSNDRSWLGMLENPVAAHLNYLDNPQVAKLIVCGFPQVAGCR